MMRASSRLRSGWSSLTARRSGSKMSARCRPGGRSWAIGSTKQIKWNHNLGTLESVKIEVARDGVNYTETIAASATNTANTTGTFSWVVTGPATTMARVRVTWTTNAAVTDVSNVNFKIQ